MKTDALAGKAALVLPLLALALCVHAFAQAKARPASATGQVWAQEEAYWRYVKTHDAKGYLSLWADDFMGWPIVDAHPAGKSSIAPVLNQHGGSLGQVVAYKLRRENGSGGDYILSSHGDAQECQRLGIHHHLPHDAYMVEGARHLANRRRHERRGSIERKQVAALEWATANAELSARYSEAHYNSSGQARMQVIDPQLIVPDGEVGIQNVRRATQRKMLGDSVVHAGAARPGKRRCASESAAERTGVDVSSSEERMPENCHTGTGA